MQTGGARYALVIFDLDGTLADSFPWFLGVINAVADRHGFKRMEAEEVPKLRGCSARRIIQHLGVPLWKLPLITRDMRRMASESLGDRPGEIAPFAGVTEMFEGLSRAGVLIGIATSNSEANVRTVLGGAAMRRVAHLACDIGMFGKAARLRQLVRAAGLPPSHCLYVGDELRDAEAARRAGVAFGAVAWGYTDAAALCMALPQEFFEEMAEIVPRIRQSPAPY